MEAKTVAATNVTNNASSLAVSTQKPFTTTEVVYQRFAIEPMDQTAVIGSRVTLPCRVLDQKGPIQWTKDDFGLGAVRNLTGYERYAMIGSDEEGRWLKSEPGNAIFTVKLMPFAASASALADPAIARYRANPQSPPPRRALICCGKSSRDPKDSFPMVLLSFFKIQKMSVERNRKSFRALTLFRYAAFETRICSGV